MKTKIAVLAALVVLLATAAGFSQMMEKVRANIPFSFVVMGKTLPAGEYDFTRIGLDNAIMVSPVTAKASSAVEALVLTRLGQAIHTTPKDSHIVFDKVGNTYYLSEFWVSGVDGFVLYVTNQKHEHRSVNVPS